LLLDDFELGLASIDVSEGDMLVRYLFPLMDICYITLSCSPLRSLFIAMAFKLLRNQATQTLRFTYIDQ